VKRKKLLWGLAIAGLLLILAVLLLPSLFTRSTPRVRDLVVTALNERFKSQVELDSLYVDTFPRPAITGSGLRLRHNGRTDIEPLMAIESFSATAGFWSLAAAPPLNLQTVELEGLDIRIPPGGLKDPNSPPSDPDDGRVIATSGRAPSVAPPRERWLRPFHRHDTRLFIDYLSAKRATLELTPKDPTKLPRIFEIHNLEMHELGRGDSGAPFAATVTNPIPAGLIETSGKFGPWEPEDPQLTRIQGEYTFKSADLNTIKGISGMLTSNGQYRGPLQRIEVQGTTDIPDFSIDLAGRPVRLTTSFQAVVDGTNGNTYLERVDATLGQTLLKTKGAVVRAKEVKGRHVILDIVIDQGRIEDLLQLAVKSSKPILTGRINLKTKFLLPAGDQDVVEKLRLDGAFTLAKARFTNVDVQKKITLLSQKGRGDEDGDSGESVVSDLQGNFVLDHSLLRFSSLRFGVPGALVQIAGTYDLRGEVMDFRGELLTDATLADMTSGFKSILARIAQPFFRRPGGGSRFPIRIQGPRSKPSFGLDVKKAFLPG
jgi:hypothetical protein